MFAAPMRILAHTSILFGSVLLFSCSNEKTEFNATIAQEKPEQEHTTTPISDTTTKLKTTEYTQGPDAEELLESFNYCRDNSENSMTCKYFIAKAICLYYNISDFERPDGQYMDFEEILPVVQSSGNWFRAGSASEQEALDRAVDAVENGQAAIAVSESDKFGHVVLILPGKKEKAPAWGGLNCPMVASFFMVPGLEPFIHKSIAYAWSKPDGIGIYIRK